MYMDTFKDRWLDFIDDIWFEVAEEYIENTEYTAGSIFEIIHCKEDWPDLAKEVKKRINEMDNYTLVQKLFE